MFWQYALFHAAMWLCPPADCLAELDLLPPLPPPAPVVCDIKPLAAPSSYPMVIRCLPESKSPFPPVRATVQVPVSSDPNLHATANFASSTHAPCTLTARITELIVDGVDVELTMQPTGQKCSPYRATAPVPFDAKCTAILKNTNNEKCKVEFVVSRPIQQQMPAPLPVATIPPATFQVTTLPAPRFLQHPPQYIPPSPPFPLTREMVPVVVPAPLVPCVAVTPTTKYRRTHSYSLVAVGNGTVVRSRSDEAEMTFARCTNEIAEVGKVTVSAGKKYVHITGQGWKGMAEQVQIDTDGNVLLTGSAKLECPRLGQGGTVRAYSVSFQVKSGQFEKLRYHEAR